MPEKLKNLAKSILAAASETALNFDKRFFAVCFAVSFLLIMFLYAAGLVPRDLAEAGDSVAEALIKAAAPKAPTTEPERPAQENLNLETIANTKAEKSPARESKPMAAEGNAPANEAMATDPAARIMIPVLSIDSPIIMPSSADFNVLNDSLTKGVVYYPGSSLPDQTGNGFLFGHSTGYRVVKNRAYTVFSRLKDLKTGDVVRLQYGRREYWYKVSSLAIKKADQALVDFNPRKRMITLSTCNIFGAKDDRYVIEAEFTASYPLRSVSASGTSS